MQGLGFRVKGLNLHRGINSNGDHIEDIMRIHPPTLSKAPATQLAGLLFKNLNEVIMRGNPITDYIPTFW